MTTPLIKKVFYWLELEGHRYDEDPLDGAMWFDITEGISKSNLPDINKNLLLMYRPPFEKNKVVFSQANHIEVYLNIQGGDVEEGILVAPYVNVPSEFKSGKIPPFIYRAKNGEIEAAPVDPEITPDTKMLRTFIGYVSIWYSALEKGGTSYSPSVINTFTNKRRVAKGKRPLYEWRTVKIAPMMPRVISESKGGTHASPRLHDRRGHLRRLRSGKNVWVKPCKVGNAALGTVFHDYEVVA